MAFFLRDGGGGGGGDTPVDPIGSCIMYCKILWDPTGSLCGKILKDERI